MSLLMSTRCTNNFMNCCFYSSSSSSRNYHSALTHIDDEGKAAMVDVSEKKSSLRVAMAFAHVKVQLLPSFLAVTTRTITDSRRR